MIADPRAFDDDAPPPAFKHRNAELQTIERAFQPALQGRRAEDVLIHGPSGVGKTTLAKHAVGQLQSRADVLTAATQALATSVAGVLRAVLQDLPGDNPPNNRATEDLALDLRERIDQPCVVVLGEADDLAETDALARLRDVPLLSVVVICHDEPRFRAQLGATSLDGHELPLERFGIDELADILAERARVGLRGDIPRGYLETIADETRGAAREGIQTLRFAAMFASQRDIPIVDVSVDEAHDRALEEIRAWNLTSLGIHHHALYELIREAGTIRPGVLHSRYEQLGDEIYHEKRDHTPVGERQRQYALDKLEEYDLIEAAESQHDEYHAVEPGLESDVVDLTDALRTDSL